MYVMKRTTVFLDETLLRNARKLARQQGVPFATVVREALARYVSQPHSGGPPAFAARFRSGSSDTSERVDELLWKDPHG